MAGQQARPLASLPLILLSFPPCYRQGVAYEKLLKGETPPPPNGEIMWNVSLLGESGPLLREHAMIARHACRRTRHSLLAPPALSPSLHACHPPAGFLASAAYQALYTWPNRERLVQRHLAAAAAAGTSPWCAASGPTTRRSEPSAELASATHSLLPPRPRRYIAGLLVVFGSGFNFHMLFQVGRWLAASRHAPPLRAGRACRRLPRVVWMVCVPSRPTT